MLGSYVMDYGTVFYGTIVLVVLWFLCTFAQYFYRTDIKKEMEETILWLLIGAILLTFLYYYYGTEYRLFCYGTFILWGLFISTFACYLYRTVIKTPAEIRKLQKKIADYIPKQWTARDAGDGFQRPSKVRLGVFGVQGSGKSSFLNSLHFAFKGYWEEVYVEKGNELDGGETLFRDPVKLSDNVTTFDTSGLVDLSVSRVQEVIAQITGKRGLNTRSHTPGEKIDCPIFIVKYGNLRSSTKNVRPINSSCQTHDTGAQHCTEFLKTLVPEVRKHLCGYPIMVVTFANRISNHEEILTAITKAGMAKGSVFFIENYTAENHEMDSKKHIALLEILEACIKRADDNITFRWRTEDETPKKNIFERIVTKEAKKNDCDNLPEKTQSDGTDRADSIDHAIDGGHVKPIKMECCKRVGVEGGKLHLDSFGIELEIPPGAIDSEAPQDISFRVLTDTPNIGNIKEDMSVCFGVQCLVPDNLVLKLPVTYTIPHCAVITRYSSVDAVLYTGEGEYSPDVVVKERIILSSSGIPSCTIRKDVLQLKMNHFSWARIKLRIHNFFFRGKTMCCRAFKEKNLALLKTPVILHANLYDDIRGYRELVESNEREHGFVSAFMEQQVRILAAEGDLKMTCYVKETVIGGPAVVSYDKLLSGTRICEPFELDFTNQPDIVAVSLKVGQIERLQVNLLFRLDFSTHRRERASPQHREQLEGRSSSEKLQTSHQSPDETPENMSGRLEEFDKILTTVARKVARLDQIDNLGKALGFEPADIQRYVKENTNASYQGTLLMLRDWRNKQKRATVREALEGVLRKAGLIHLADELFVTL